MFFLPTRKLLFLGAGLLYPSKSFLFPQLDCPIPTTTGKHLSIWTYGHTANGVSMPCEGVQFLAGMKADCYYELPCKNHLA
jgi:hypothetical protein